MHAALVDQIDEQPANLTYYASVFLTKFIIDDRLLGIDPCVGS